jgi:hypothetical protein
MAIIGRLPDTRMMRGLPGADILSPDKRTMAANKVWIDGIIASGKPVYMVSARTSANLRGGFGGGPTVFAQEIQWLKNAGYTEWGNWLVPR